MTDRYDALDGEIMRMMEDDRGLVRSKLADLLEKEVGAWKPDVSIGMVASASDHSKLSLKAQWMEAHWRECRAGEDVCKWNDQALRTSSLGPPDEPVLVRPEFKLLPNAGLLVASTWPDGQTRTYSMDDLRPNDTCGND
jgi:hypothetical protein